MDNNALGFVEAKGITGVVEAQDRLPKTGNIQFLNLLPIGGGHVITVFKGGLAELQYALDSNYDPEKKHSSIYMAKVLEGPHPEILDIASDNVPDKRAALQGSAMTIIETRGYVSMVIAADTALKSGDVSVSNWLSIGGGISAVVLRGDVASCRSAMENATAAVAEEYRYASVIIENPHEQIDLKTPVFSSVRLKKGSGTFIKGTATGLVETRSFAALIFGLDRGLKYGDTKLSSVHKVGSTYISGVFKGEVSEIQSSVKAASEGINMVKSIEGSLILPNSHEDVHRIV